MTCTSISISFRLLMPFRNVSLNSFYYNGSARLPLHSRAAETDAGQLFEPPLNVSSRW